MSEKPDVMAIRLIGEEVVRLLSLSDAHLSKQAAGGLRLIAELALWREAIPGQDCASYRLAKRISSSAST